MTLELLVGFAINPALGTSFSPVLSDSFARAEIMKASLSLVSAQRLAVVKPTTAPSCRSTSGFGETGTWKVT